jgi:hypothetical protein
MINRRGILKSLLSLPFLGSLMAQSIDPRLVRIEYRGDFVWRVGYTGVVNRYFSDGTASHTDIAGVSWDVLDRIMHEIDGENLKCRELTTTTIPHGYEMVYVRSV